MIDLPYRDLFIQLVFCNNELSNNDLAYNDLPRYHDCSSNFNCLGLLLAKDYRIMIYYALWSMISYNDLSCKDLSCNDLSCNDLLCIDLSCIDLSCNDLSRSDLSCSDQSCNDLSCNDVSCIHLSCIDLSCIDLSCIELSSKTKISKSWLFALQSNLFRTWSRMTDVLAGFFCLTGMLVSQQTYWNGSATAAAAVARLPETHEREFCSIHLTQSPTWKIV